MTTTTTTTTTTTATIAKQEAKTQEETKCGSKIKIGEMRCEWKTRRDTKGNSKFLPSIRIIIQERGYISNHSGFEW